MSALVRYRGCGIVVSHDRSLLNNLTSKTLRVCRGRVELWNGSYDVALAAWTAEEAETRHKLDKLKAERKKLNRRLDEQHRKTTHQDAKRIRERRAAGKHDLDTRGSAASYEHERGQKTGAQTVSSMSNSLGKLAADIDLAVRRSDRIRITGPNGVGKTSLLDRLASSLAIPAEWVLTLPQETMAAQGRAWLDAVVALPYDDRGRVMSLVASLGTDPGPLLASGQPSPGETRKIALALGLGTPKWLLVLDEHERLDRDRRRRHDVSVHYGW